ncbi:centrosomal protein of 290 kDa-like isoform X1 [Anopheles ziemanni]|uniref:centrosomal protein of 290 kDa-like isoform X1 n=1 Tax=Anopheles coustani TaxID=139045 RepID=UPI002659413C|nr:centrosomal protein of 290 kDa-like isoform X1 [Anopheles coustani]XP_058168370.1 centrosomal protein of 290 kDa-like isoform X1 [Anopheles ziemanni]
MSRLIHDASDEGVQAVPGSGMEEHNSRSGQTWHQLLLHPSPSSSQLSYVSEMPIEGGSHPSTPRQTRHGIFGEQDESATNYDSGNFSFSEPGAAREKPTPVLGCTGGGDLHQRFVQLNTELYQTKTELLAYKYKWNEIRNEIELSWSKKLDKLSDEKNYLLSELEAVRKEIARLKEAPVDPNGRELLRIRSELRDITIRLECKEKANEYLKQKIAEQHVEKENLCLRVKNLEQMGCEEHSEMCRVKASERWFREELHRCQNENAKLKESYATLDNLLSKERCERGALIEAAKNETRQTLVENNKLFSIIEQTNATNEQAKEKKEYDKKQLESEIALFKDAHFRRETTLLEKNALLEKQNVELQTVVRELQQTLEDQQLHAKTLAVKEKEALEEIRRLREGPLRDEAVATVERYRTEIETLSAQLALESFNKRQIDVSVEQLKAQVKVLSINLASRPCQRSPAVEECELGTLRQRNRELEEQCNRLVSEKQHLESDLAMCSERAKQHYNQLLLGNIRSIQSKNLDLELKLGQCVTAGGKSDEPSGEQRGDDMARRSAETIRKLAKDINELEQKVMEQQREDNGKDKNGKKSRSLCPKHGPLCRHNVLKHTAQEDDDDEMRNLRLWLKAIESENRRRLQRYEINNRTLLQKVKEHARERNQAKQRVEELENEHGKCTKLRCEMASARERCLLLEADLATAKQEATTLRTEKERLIFLLQNNCLLTSDGDVWGSLRSVFKELRDLQQVHKENKYLQQQLEAEGRKIELLEQTAADWKLAAEVQTSEADELRSELTVKTLQLEDSQRTIDQLVGENSSLQQSASVAGENEKDLTEKLSELNRLVRIQEIRLETAHERLKLYQESERILAASKDRFFNDLQSLQDAILVEKQEKYELEEEVRELRQNMVNAVGNSLQNFHPTDSSNGGSGQQSASIISPDPQSLPLSPSSLDIDHLRALVEESSRKRYSLQPLHECVSSLKLEMDHLNSVLQIGDGAVQQQQHQQQQHQQQPRFPLSLLDELNDATNGHYGSR